MGWDKKHYKDIKAFVLSDLGSVPVFCDIKCPVEWAKTFLPLISQSIESGDYEAAKATSDAIKEFLNGFISDEAIKFKDSDILKIPEYKKVDVRGIICLGGGKAQII